MATNVTAGRTESRTAPAIPTTRQPLPDAAPASQPGARPPAPRRRRLPRYTWAGTANALVFGYLSVTPSLLPRSWLLQGIVAGITGAIGYGLGVFLAWFVYQLTDRRPSPAVRRRAWQVLGALAVPLGVVTLWAGMRWQEQIHALMGMPRPERYRIVGTVLLAVLTFALLVAVARLIRRFTRWVIRQVQRMVPRRAARAIGVVAVTVLLIFLLNGVLFQGLVGAADKAFGTRDGGTAAGVVQPTAPERSGSAASLVAWNTLGSEGRTFVAGGPPPDRLGAFSGRPAVEPVRAYAGLKSAADPTERAALAVRDLQRAGGFDRKVLVVATTTGTGWIDPAAADALEYEFGGDTAIVGMQYSYLPSWISFLVDQTKAREAGRALFDAVYGTWAQLPTDRRPKLYVFGESLGSFGGEAAFTGLGDIVNRTDGVLWAGPPNFNELWRSLVDDRAPGSPEWRPVYRDGRTVRFADGPGDLTGDLATWGPHRVLYLQNASDPIVWWTPRLIFSPPDWLSGRRGPDVDQSMHWIPFVTFWQVTADLPFATGVPAGHGHHYTADYADGWAAVTQPPGWTPADTERLRSVLSTG